MPPAVTVNVSVVIDEPSIRSLNVTRIGEDTGTFVAPDAGTGNDAVGATTSAVVNVHTYGDESAFPERSFAPVVTVAVYRVSDDSAADGVNVAVLSA